MKNFVQPGNTITVTLPQDTVGGEGVLVGRLFGVAAFSAVNGAECEVAVVGVYDLAKRASDAFGVGAPVYFDSAAKECVDDPDSSADAEIGIAIAAAGAGATTVRVRLHGVVTPA